MFHYKDNTPMKTILKIRKILSNLGICLIEKKWHNISDLLFSVRLEIAGTEIGVNGKGITPELCLASAYGEFMERLCNQYLYPVFAYYQFDEQLAEYKSFYLAPDEKYFNLEDQNENFAQTVSFFIANIKI